MQYKATVRIFDLIKDLEKKTGKLIQKKDIADGTGLNRRTVSALMDGSSQRIEMKTINVLLDYFHAQGMPVQVGELFVVERGE